VIESRALPPGIDLLALHRRSPSRYPLLLESAASGTAQGRWDLLLAASGTGLRLGQDGVTRTLQGAQLQGAFLHALDDQWRALRVARGEPRWPFRGGWALLLNYELASQIEPVLRLARGDRDRPDQRSARGHGLVVADEQLASGAPDSRSSLHP